MAGKLAKLNSTLSIDILADMLTAEKHPLALAPIAAQCKAQDDRLRQALISFLQRENLPYMYVSQIRLDLLLSSYCQLVPMVMLLLLLDLNETKMIYPT